LLLISWVGGRWTVKKHEEDVKKLKRIERGNLIAMSLVLLGCYLLLKFTNQTFTNEYYLLLIFLFNARLSLALHRLLSPKIDASLPQKEKESRMYGTIILIIALGLFLAWLLIGYISPGSLGTLSVAA
jgi:flagellar biogenesis protein FliO